jgi:hypothetical protein
VGWVGGLCGPVVGAVGCVVGLVGWVWLWGRVGVCGVFVFGGVQSR